MIQKGTRKQHYVPQFYLQNFKDNEGKLCVYSKKEKKFYKSSPRDICHKRYLYETEWKEPSNEIGQFILFNHLEKLMSERESKYAPVIYKIINICQDLRNSDCLVCNKQEKEILYSFVANLYCRNKWYLELIDKWVKLDNVVNDKELQVYREIVESIGLGDFEAYIQASLKKLCVDDEFTGGSANHFKQQLMLMEYCILETDLYSFITADCPFVCSLSMDENNLFKSIFIPIHPKCGILFFEPKIHKDLHEYKNRIYPVDKEVVYELNRELFNDSEHSEYLISHDFKTLKEIIE